MTNSLYIGLISGTSVDAIDVGLFDFSSAQPMTIATLSAAYPEDLRDAVITLCTPGTHEIERMGVLDTLLGEQFANAAMQLLASTGIDAQNIQAIGSHGQTIRHNPPDHTTSSTPYTLQIGNPNIIAERTGITTVADFRRRDMAVGGHGAPLVPAFHQAVFRAHNEHRIILNIGGIANITILPADNQPVTGFDTGPGNILMDMWSQQAFRTPCDLNGAHTAQGTTQQNLLQSMLSDPYFARTPPKSTGREYFTLAWLQNHLSTDKIDPLDLMATLCDLTAKSITQAVHHHAPNTQRILVCGGGIHNHSLMHKLKENFAEIAIESTEKYGINPDFVEAAAFAWLARQTLQNLPGNIPAVTGAKREVPLGGIYIKPLRT